MRGDRYSCFDELRQHEEQGRDFAITTGTPSGINMFDPRSHMAAASNTTRQTSLWPLPARTSTCTCSKGIKAKGNADLHVTSTRFDEPSCLDILSVCDLVVAIHGCRGEDERVLLGGLHRTMKREISDSLYRHGVHIESAGHAYPATAQMNICNRGRTRQGVQLELSAPLRRSPNRHRVVDALRAVLLRA
jgi:phage replication-related protein YjqB (UPF0714/DUF867 family)